MRTAFAKLGYDKVYHMVSILQNPRDAIMWTEAADAKYFGKGKPYERADWDALLGDYNVGTFPIMILPSCETKS